MASVADALRVHVPASLAKFGDRVPLIHRKVLGAIMRCRTGELGSVMLHCDGCGKDHWVGRSCGNRHCPNCQKHKTADWLAKQTDRLLPVHHFLVTFTVPQELRMLLRGQQRDGYTGLFDCGAETIRAMGSATKSLKDCELGFFGVLHTWGRDPMVYHPHVHFVVPGGGIHRNTGSWQPTPKNFLFHHGTVCRVYKAKFADRLREVGLYDQVDPAVWKKTWTVDIQAVGDGTSVLKYLAPYVYRVAISDNRIESVDETSVTYRYTPSKTRESKTRTVSGETFVHGFSQHILPPRLQKIRYYGWMSSNSRYDFDAIRWAVYMVLGWTYTLRFADKKLALKRTRALCNVCGGELKLMILTNSVGEILYSRAPAYIDTG